MKKIRVDLNGEAESLWRELTSKGMSDASIIGKALKCLEMVKNGELIKPSDIASSATSIAASATSQVKTGQTARKKGSIDAELDLNKFEKF